MYDIFRLQGTYSSEPSSASCGSTAATVYGLLSEVVGLTNKSVWASTLAADAPAAVNLGGLSNVHVLVLRAVGGKVRVRLTSTDGSQQSVPVDGLLVVVSLSVPITAIDVTRVAGVETQVDVFMGERA